MTDILTEAAELINGDRAKDYGDVTDNFKTIAELWEAYTGVSFGPHDVSMMMVLVKVARQRHGYHRDSTVDIAGYAALAEKVDLHPVRQPQDFWDDIDQSIVEAQEKRERETTSKPPRVWDSLTEVPEGVLVLDADGGCDWEGEGPDGSTAYDKWGPFTEVLDTERKGSE